MWEMLAKGKCAAFPGRPRLRGAVGEISQEERIQLFDLKSQPSVSHVPVLESTRWALQDCESSAGSVLSCIENARNTWISSQTRRCIRTRLHWYWHFFVLSAIFPTCCYVLSEGFLDGSGVTNCISPSKPLATTHWCLHRCALGGWRGGPPMRRCQASRPRPWSLRDGYGSGHNGAIEKIVGSNPNVCQRQALKSWSPRWIVDCLE